MYDKGFKEGKGIVYKDGIKEFEINFKKASKDRKTCKGFIDKYGAGKIPDPNFKESHFDGEGTQFFPDGNLYRQGIWKGHNFVSGVMYSEDGTKIYEGEFC